MATNGNPKLPPWPAVPIPKPEEVYAGISDQAKDYPMFLESILRPEHNFEKPEALSDIRVLRAHALPNALLPAVTLIAINLGYVVAGAITVERDWTTIDDIADSAVRRLSDRLAAHPRHPPAHTPL